MSFKNVIIIMTSNVGSQFILEAAQAGNADEMRSKVTDLLRTTFRPEFLNRIDDIVTFNSLSYGDIERIVDLQLDDVRDRLAHERLTMKVTPAAVDSLSIGGLDPVFGARPLRRLIQNKVVDGIANLIIDGKLGENDVVLIDANDDGDIVVSRDDKASEESRAHHSAAPEDVPVEPDAVE